MRLDNVFIAGLAVHLPERFPTERAVRLGLYEPAEGEHGGWLSVCVAGDTPAPDLAVKAGSLALERSGLEPADIDLLTHSSAYHQGPDAWSPQHYVLRHTLGTEIPAVEVRQGCNGMITAMELAANHLHAAPGRTAALLTSGDNFGVPLVDRWRSMTNVVLGDAGGGVVISRRSGFAQVLSTVGASIPELELLHRGDEPLFPPGATVSRTIDLNARALQYAASEDAARSTGERAIGRVTARTVKQALADAGADIPDIARVTHTHWGHERFLRRTLAPLGIDVARGTLDFGRGVGHLGATDQIAGLDHLVGTGAVGPGDLVMMIGVGVGISISCTVVRILERPHWATA